MDTKVTKPVYLRTLTIENIRSFGKQQQLSFTSKDDKVAQWNLILGNNGTGKTTILKSIALACLKNVSHLRDIDIDFFYRKIELLPSITFDLGSSWRNTKTTIFESSSIKNKPVNVFGFSCEGPKDKLLAMPFFGYGASRLIGETVLSKGRSNFSAKSLFDDNANLINAEEWLIQADYHDLSNRKKTNYKNSINEKERILKILKKLFKGEIDDIKIDNSNKVPRVLFKTKYGLVRLHQLSLGYKTLIAWMVDMASRMLDYYSESKNPLKEPAIVVVDEIDLHLHPSFQRELVDFLTSTFPRTQFIVTAHSPLIVQAFEDANIFLLERKGNQTIVNQNPIGIKNWRVDQILTSDLFGLKSARSKQSEKAMTQRRKILSKSNLTVEDEVTLQRLEENTDNYFIGDNKKEIDGFDLIKDFARKLGEKKQKGEL